MNKEQKCRLLEERLKRLEGSQKDNQGICRRIRRDIRNIRDEKK